MLCLTLCVTMQLHNTTLCTVHRYHTVLSTDIILKPSTCLPPSPLPLYKRHSNSPATFSPQSLPQHLLLLSTNIQITSTQNRPPSRTNSPSTSKINRLHLRQPEIHRCVHISSLKGKGRVIPEQAWTGPEGSRWLRLPDFKTTGT